MLVCGVHTGDFMSLTFTVRGPSRETVSEFYYYFYRRLLRAVENGPELELLHETDDGCERSFALNNGDVPELKAACDGLDMRGCGVVAPAQYTIAEPAVATRAADSSARARPPGHGTSRRRTRYAALKSRSENW